VCDSFMDLFTYTGVYEVIVTDRGTNFCGNMTQEFLKRLSVAPRLLSPAHPQGNGLVERFNASFKAMLHFAMREHGRAWHTVVPFLVWALREVPNATTGLSPFMLQFGIPPRGVLHVLKQTWTGQQRLPSSKPVDQYMNDLVKCLETAGKFANEHSKIAQAQYAKYYNARAADKSFTMGEQVIVLEKDSNSKTFAKWQTGVIAKVLSPYSYLVNMPNDACRHLHANKLRKLIVREQHIGIIKEQDTDFGEIEVIPAVTDETESLPSKHVDRSKLAHLSVEQQVDLLSLVDEYKDCFSNDPGFCDVVEHEIFTRADFKPRRCRAYKVPEVLKVEIERQVDQLLRLGFIVSSNSPMASGVVCVVKPDKTIRLTCDYRYVNQFTIGDCQPMPNLKDSMYRVARAKYITLCDAKSGFWQLNVRSEHRWLTSFVTHHGQWEWVRMPFGLKCASNTFVRAMQIILRPIRDYCESYVDDAAVISDHFKEHVDVHCRGFLDSIRASGLTLNIRKCKFAQTKVVYVGHLIGGGEHGPDPSKLSAMANLKLPETKKGLRQALGVFGFYRSYVKGYATVAKVLTDMIGKNKPNRLSWMEAARLAFVELRRCVCSPPVLVSPTLYKPFLLYTDASNVAVGSCLAQYDEENMEHPVAYGSQKLTVTQSAWSTIEREAYAVIWALGKFRDIIFGCHITVFSDHDPLKYLTESAPKSAKLTRWALALQEYDVTLKYTKGPLNKMADGLSRLESEPSCNINTIIMHSTQYAT